MKRSVFNSLSNSFKRTNITNSGKKKELLENIIYCKDCCGTITLFKDGRSKKRKGDCCTFKRSKSRNKTCCSHCFEYSIF